MSYALHTNGSKFKKGGKPSQSGVAVGGVLSSYMGYFQGYIKFLGYWGLGEHTCSVVEKIS